MDNLSQISCCILAMRYASAHINSPTQATELRQYDESNHIRIDALHLKKVGNNNVILLNDISLVIPPRKFVALVGGSGAGKSTLMDALNGLRPAQHGKVLYNGVDYYHNLAASIPSLAMCHRMTSSTAT